MKFFIDSADLKEIDSFMGSGLVEGVTTNPSLVAKAGGDFFQLIAQICRVVKGPVSAEVIATERGEMIEEGRRLASIAENVAVKLPATWSGLEACHVLSSEGIMVNVTLCFSANQALLAARAGATFISPFVGRLDDTGQDGLGLVQEIREIYDSYEDLDTYILAASVRSPQHVKTLAMIGADIATVPPSVFRALILHPLTEKGLETFLKDWSSRECVG